MSLSDCGRIRETGTVFQVNTDRAVSARLGNSFIYNDANFAIRLLNPGSLAVANGNSCYRSWQRCQRDPQRVEDMVLGMGESFVGNRGEKSVSATKRANVSVTGGSEVILFSCPFGDMKVPLSELGLRV